MPTESITPHLSENMINSTTLILIRFIETNVKNPVGAGRGRLKKKASKNAQRE